MLALHQVLGALRRRLTVLRKGAYERLDAGSAAVAFARGAGRGRLVVVANPAKAAESVAAGQLNEWLGGPPLMVGSFAYSGASGAVGRGGLVVPAQSVVVVGRSDSKESE
jgi:hypothetical protein